jgi:hypothetical protein
MIGEYSLSNLKTLVLAAETDARLSQETSEALQVLENPENYTEDEVLYIEINELEDEIRMLFQQILSKNNDLLLKNLEKEEMHKKRDRQETVEREPCEGCKIKKLLLKPKDIEPPKKKKDSRKNEFASITVRENLESITLTFVIEPENCNVNFADIKYGYISISTGKPVTGRRDEQFSPLIQTKPLPGGYRVNGNSITLFINQINRAAREATGAFEAGIPVWIQGVFKCQCCGKVSVKRFVIEITD